MSSSLDSWNTDSRVEPPVGLTAVPGRMPLLSPYNAWRILQNRTGINVGRSTFYRWVQGGKVFSMKDRTEDLHSLARDRERDPTIP
jgi:hypothetical protein